MTTNKLQADAVGIPRFTATPVAGAGIFDLTSHARAREALDFGLSVGALGFNIFVVGEDRSARMSATLANLEAAMEKRPTPADWIYLNNFRQPDQPLPLSLPPGTGRKFCDALRALIPKLREAFAASFTGDAYQARVLALREQAEHAVNAEMENLAQAAQAHGLQLVQGQDGALRLMPAAQRPAHARAAARRSDRARDGDRADPRAAPRRQCARPPLGAASGAQPRHCRRGGQPRTRCAFARLRGFSGSRPLAHRDARRHHRDAGALPAPARQRARGRIPRAALHRQSLRRSQRGNSCAGDRRGQSQLRASLRLDRISPESGLAPYRFPANPRRCAAPRQWRRLGAARRSDRRQSRKLGFPQGCAARSHDPHRRAWPRTKPADRRRAAAGADTS